MVETILGIWLFLLTFGAGYLTARIAHRRQKSARPPHTVTGDDFGWQELLNFLQYDGSGKLSSNRKGQGGLTDEEQYNSRANSTRVRTGHSL